MEAIVLDQHSYYDEIIKQRRMQPANDVATLLARAEVDGERLTDQQLYTALNLFTVAGFQAPAQQLSMAVMLLARQPDLVAQLIREPTKISDFIEEILRFDNPTLGLLRQTTGAVEMHGATIPAGAGVALLIGAANRDPQQFPAPDRFELARANIKTHLGFGHGAHTCLGAALARLEMRIGLEVLLPYIERIELPNNTQLIWHSTFIGRLLRGLPIRWKS
jgi:cytochrome P450